ncbi:TPA: hypothetical protein HA265_03000 [Candidatus Woesearchaeota archaeon]|nr:hypothetical protein [Candidatus Woesearchaeota archaeon]
MFFTNWSLKKMQRQANDAYRANREANMAMWALQETMGDFLEQEQLGRLERTSFHLKDRNCKNLDELYDKYAKRAFDALSVELKRILKNPAFAFESEIFHRTAEDFHLSLPEMKDLPEEVYKLSKRYGDLINSWNSEKLNKRIALVNQLGKDANKLLRDIMLFLHWLGSLFMERKREMYILKTSDDYVRQEMEREKREVDKEAA